MQLIGREVPGRVCSAAVNMLRILCRSLLLAFTVVLASCSPDVPCDPDAHAWALAGEAATDCGFVPVGEDRSGALDCAESAAGARVPFVVGYAGPGRDSDVRYFVVGDPDGAHWLLGFDGGAAGGPSRVSASRCEGPLMRGLNPLGDEHLYCFSGESAVLCQGPGL